MKRLFLLVFLLPAVVVRAQDTPKRISVDTPKISKAGDWDKTFTKVEIEAGYPGGAPAWAKYLSKTMHYPDDAVNNEIQGTVIVSFIVDQEGNVSNIEAISGPLNGGLRQEAIRVIRQSGKWTPAIQNGYQVKSIKKQPLVFKLSISK